MPPLRMSATSKRSGQMDTSLVSLALKRAHKRTRRAPKVELSESKQEEQQQALNEESAIFCVSSRRADVDQFAPSERINLVALAAAAATQSDHDDELRGDRISDKLRHDKAASKSRSTSRTTRGRERRRRRLRLRAQSDLRAADQKKPLTDAVGRQRPPRMSTTSNSIKMFLSLVVAQLALGLLASGESSSSALVFGAQQQDQAFTERHLAAAAVLPQPQALQQQQQQQQQQQSAHNSLVRTVNPGDRVNIPCSLANMGGSIQFAKDDQPIVLDSGCAHCQLDISNDGQASLTINRVSQRDQGHWQCWRLDRDGQVKQRVAIIQLVVTNSPELPILVVNDKELLAGNSVDATISVKENEIVNFKCLIRGASTPVDYVQWMLDSSQNVTHQSQLMMEFSAQDNNYLTQSVLRLNATKAMNLKSVSCLSNHQLWLTPMTVTAFLNVLYEPSFTISREPGFGVPVSEGMSVILKCEIDSNPSSAPIWIRDADTNKSTSGDQQQQQQQSRETTPSSEPVVLDTQEDGSVVFQPARRSDSGWYRCKTENKYGNFSSFGYYLNVRPATSGAAAGGAQAAQGAQQQPLLQSLQQQQQQQQQLPQRVRLAHAQQADSPLQPSTRLLGPNQPAAQVAPVPPHFLLQPRQQGAHQMSAQTSSNMINNDQPVASTSGSNLGDNSKCAQKAKLADGFPEIENPVSSVQAVLGRQLILPLRFCCQPGPARVFWIHRHLAMIPGRMFGPYITRDVYTTYNSFYCYESTFEIESVKPEDIGTVYVFVSNEKGHAGAQIHIQLAKQQQQQHQSIGPVDQHGQLLQLGTRFHLLAGSAAQQTAPLWPALQLACCLLGLVCALAQFWRRQ